VDTAETDAEAQKRPRIGGDTPRGFELNPAAAGRVGGSANRLRTVAKLRNMLSGVLEKVHDGGDPATDLGRARVLISGAIALGKLIELTDLEKQLREVRAWQREFDKRGGH